MGPKGVPHLKLMAPAPVLTHKLKWRAFDGQDLFYLSCKG